MDDDAAMFARQKGFIESHGIQVKHLLTYNTPAKNQDEKVRRVIDIVNNATKAVVGKYDDVSFKTMQSKTRDNLILDCRVGDCVGFQIADIYPAQKVIMFLYYCLLTENVEPKELAAYMICVNLFNSMCACYMEGSWNESIKNEYVYIYDRNINEREKIKMIKIKDNKAYRLQITKETIESFTKQELAVFLSSTKHAEESSTQPQFELDKLGSMLFTLSKCQEGTRKFMNLIEVIYNMIVDYFGFKSEDELRGTVKNAINEIKLLNKLKKRYEKIQEETIDEEELAGLEQRYKTDDIGSIQNELLAEIADLTEYFSNPNNFANSFNCDLTILNALYRLF